MRPSGLHILILGLYYQPEPTGIAPYTSGLARGLVERGHRVRAVTGYPHYPQWRITPGYRGLRRHENIDGVDVTRVRHPVPRSSTGIGRITMEAAYAAHASTIRSGRPDFVLAVSPALLSVATALTWRRSGRTAVGVVCQDMYCKAIDETGAFGGRISTAVADLERRLLSRVDGVSVIHDTFAAAVTALGVDPAKVTVIRNWSHITQGTGERAATRHRLSWRDDEVIALHAGNMGEKQGLENVVEAARIAQTAHLPIRFVLLGDGARRSALEQLAADVSTVQFLDPLPDGEFENALAAADVLILNEKPGVAEMSVPSKLTSYFAAGRPVVAAIDPRSASTLEMHSAAAGVCVASGDPRLLVEAALRTGHDKASAIEMGAKGRQYAHRVLSESAAIDAYEDWILELTDAVTVRTR
ncbi:glycosyl transferase family 1 [Mycolicibacterium wolinskyi]|uniref:Glycosyl transferase family 1 n=1 Tax=Mycolicibacterium wolinskyi TaxID=59750 RepID=A0A132PR60_9MYCO|nr:glycosyltransferase [Mycolicibacterium wolinskyi]KWX24820.1 glycosyl transferase family 1 [Mycolicibacterium wolinskyi]